MILIKGGKIKPITGAEIENGELLIGDDGKIAAIGKTVDAPADAKVVDATGCGDTYSAGYLYRRLQGASPLEAGKFAAAMCTIKLEHNGPFNRTQKDILQIMGEA